MPRVKITRRAHFCAAHRLENPDWPEERNRDVFGPCANPNWHGHNYDLDVTVESELNPDTGFVMDLGDLRDLVETRVVRDLDHKNLNIDVEWMRGAITSTENLVVGIWRRLATTMPEGVTLSRLVLWETDRNFVEYTGG
ncbi:MAG: 6-carboxytetrahydropterin synthase [Gemmatimonadota bacterium]|nr:MAG: 6-carboxytetrahydropterin synthase [Gemmatimonadota bacterium]